MRMPSFLVKRRRQRKANQIVDTGRELEKIMAIRSHIDGSHPHTASDAAYLDSEIERLKRKLGKMQDYIRNTPPL